MPATVPCWFDYASPFAYLGTTQIERVAREAGAEVVFEPFLLGALFKSIGTPLVPLATFSDAKRRHYLADLHRHADVYGVPLRFSSHFPIRSVDALRLTLLAPEAARAALVHRVMRAAWADDQDVADRAVLAACAEDVGLDRALLARLDDDATKQALRAATDRAVALGLPGAPCFVVGAHVYWGQDRLDFVRRALAGMPPAEGGA